MPHQCVKCGAVYADGSNEILAGCSSCSAKLFFFIKQERLDEIKDFQVKLTKKEKAQIERDVFDIVGVKDGDAPVVLDFESIRVLKPGKYELDLVNMFKDNPLVYRLDEGKYVIDIPESFKKILDSNK